MTLAWGIQSSERKVIVQKKMHLFTFQGIFLCGRESILEPVPMASDIAPAAGLRPAEPRR